MLDKDNRISIWLNKTTFAFFPSSFGVKLYTILFHIYHPSDFPR